MTFRICHERKMLPNYVLQFQTSKFLRMIDVKETINGMFTNKL